MKIRIRAPGKGVDKKKASLSYLLHATACVTAALLFFMVLSAAAVQSDLMKKKKESMKEELTQISQQDHPEWEGIAGSIRAMNDFGQSIRTKKNAAPGQAVLVGAKQFNRTMLQRQTFARQASKASIVGEMAQQMVAENQLPYDEYYTLLKIVEAEATGEDARGKQLIAGVVLNRVKDPHFPDTISEVVWEQVDGYAQFSPTIDGRINSCVITQDTIDAVQKALDGDDISEGALFFVARSSAEKKNLDWFDSSLIKLFEYGGHEFYTFREYGEDAGNGSETQNKDPQKSQTSALGAQAARHLDLPEGSDEP